MVIGFTASYYYHPACGYGASPHCKLTEKKGIDRRKINNYGRRYAAIFLKKKVNNAN